jgi:hypothetical protein
MEEINKRTDVIISALKFFVLGLKVVMERMMIRILRLCGKF